MTAFAFHRIYFGGHHDSAFKMELFETLFTDFSNKSMSIRKTLNISTFSGSIWSPTCCGAHKLIERIWSPFAQFIPALYRGLKRINVCSESIIAAARFSETQSRKGLFPSTGSA
jgi:hypothetical protein